jgi:Tfp pilus assembly protein PilO
MKKKQFNPMVFAAMAAATLVVGGGLSFWQYGRVDQLNRQVAHMRSEAKDEGALTAQLAETQAKLDMCVAQLSHLEQGVPEMAYVPTLLKELEQVGQSNGLQVLGVRPIPKQAAAPKSTKGNTERAPKKAYNELNIEVRGRGSYRSVMNFMIALKSFPKIVAVRTVTLTPKMDGNQYDQAPLLDVQIELRSYLFPERVAVNDKPARRPSAVDPTAAPTMHRGGFMVTER